MLNNVNVMMDVKFNCPKLKEDEVGLNANSHYPLSMVYTIDHLSVPISSYKEIFISNVNTLNNFEYIIIILCR